MTLFDNLLTVFVLVVLAVIIYLRSTNKTLVDFVREMKGVISEAGEEVTE